MELRFRALSDSLLNTIPPLWTPVANLDILPAYGPGKEVRFERNKRYFSKLTFLSVENRNQPCVAKCLFLTEDIASLNTCFASLSVV